MPNANGDLYRHGEGLSDSPVEVIRAVLKRGEDGDEGIHLLLHLHRELPAEGLVEVEVQTRLS